MTWTAKLQSNYVNFAQWCDYSRTYGLASRLGFASDRAAWKANPTISGSTNPADFKVVKDDSPDRVIFRKFADGEVIAWLPDNPANLGRCDSYMHVGQHGEGCYPAATTPATPAEYAPLLQELQSIGYKLRVVKRLSGVL